MSQPNHDMPKDIRDYMTPPRKRRIETDDDGSDAAPDTSQASALPTSQAQAAPATPQPAAQGQDQKPRLLDSPAAERPNPVQNATTMPSISETHAGSSANPVVCHNTSSDDDSNLIEEQGIAVILQRPTAEQNQTSSPNTKSPTSRKSPKKPQTKKERQSGKPSRSNLRKPQEAIESSATSDNRSCEESDSNAKGLFPDAAELYRASIMGVRNKSSARNRKSAAEDLCPVCARFADFLKIFIQHK
jgi:hypothetical protein